MMPLLAWAFRGICGISGPTRQWTQRIYEGSLDQDVKIEFLGLWDTVDAYGSPIEEMTRGWDNFVWPLSMREQNLSPEVKKAVHAL